MPQVEHAAEQARLDLLPLWGEQDAGFVHGALPVGSRAGADPWARCAVRLRLAERPGHRATTANAQAIYPFFAENGLGEGGVFIGTDVHGSAFTYDPFVLYERRVVSNPNLFIAGEVGAGKSSLVKTYLYRQALFGRVPWIADPKGEYRSLAHALGVAPIRLVPGGEVRLNPIARDAGPDGQLNLLRALAAGSLDRRLQPEEEGALREALRAVNAGKDEPTLPAIVELLFEPAEAMAKRLHTTVRQLAQRTRERRARHSSGYARATCAECSTGRRRPACGSTAAQSCSTCPRSTTRQLSGS